MALTPNRADTSSSSLTPVRFLDSPRQKPFTDESLIAKNRLDEITKSLIDNFSKWQSAQKRGQSLCTSIEVIKTRCLERRMPEDSIYPEELAPYCEKLTIILAGFKDIVANTGEYLKQLKGLVKLVGDKEEVFYRTWLLQDFVEVVTRILKRYRDEYVVKKLVTEEIAHCQERSDLIRMSSLWEYPAHVDDSVRCLFLFLAEEIRVK